MPPAPASVGAGGALLALLALSGCGGTGGPGATNPDRSSHAVSTTMTPRALAGAVIDHVGESASAVAPLAGRDGVPAGGIGVEVAFPVKVGDSTHVRAVVSHATGLASNCRPKLEYETHCEMDTVEGRLIRYSWANGEPEEDPGTIQAQTVTDGGAAVTVYAYGPFVRGDPRQGRVARLGRAVEAIAADPAVGYRTSDYYVAQGARISDRAWLDYYGQGDGAPPPSRH